MVKHSISDRIKQLVSHFSNGNNVHFAHLIGTNEANIRNYIGGVKPKYDILAEIANKLEINCEWLLTGQGEMLKSNSETLPQKKEDQSDFNQLIFIANKETIDTQKKLIASLEQRIRELERSTSKPSGFHSVRTASTSNIKQARKETK